MIVYHGTSERSLDAILSGGLSPVQDSNWEGSNRWVKNGKLVYVTTKSPVNFAVNSCWDGSRGVVIKLDVDEDNLCPDVDFLEVIRRELLKRGERPPVVDVTNIEDGLIAARAYGGLSLKKVGLAAHLGTIEPSRVTSHAVLDFKVRRSMLDLQLQEHVGVLRPSMLFDEKEFNTYPNLNSLGIKFG